MSRITALGATGLSVNGVIFDFLDTGIAPLRQRSHPTWLYRDFNDPRHTRRGPRSELPVKTRRSVYKLLTGEELPEVFEYLDGARPLRLVENKYDIITVCPRWGPELDFPTRVPRRAPSRRV